MEHKDRFTIDEQKLIDLLGHGEAAARTQRELTAITGFSPRVTRELLESIRKKDVVIAASDAGRFIPETLDELQHYVRRVQSQVRNMCIALAPARRLLKQWGGGEDD